MNTPFDNLPVEFTPETIDMVQQEYKRIQREHVDMNLAADVSNEFRINVINAHLQAIADFPHQVEPAAVLQMAVYVLAWVEATNG